jgi:hypothetical protein
MFIEFRWIVKSFWYKKGCSSYKYIYFISVILAYYRCRCGFSQIVKGELHNMALFTAAKFNCDKLKLEGLHLKSEINLNNNYKQYLPHIRHMPPLQIHVQAV